MINIHYLSVVTAEGMQISSFTRHGGGCNVDFRKNEFNLYRVIAEPGSVIKSYSCSQVRLGWHSGDRWS